MAEESQIQMGSELQIQEKGLESMMMIPEKVLDSVLQAAMKEILEKGQDLETMMMMTIQEKDQVLMKTLEKDLVKPCLLWAFSDSESKLEREAMNQIDDLMGGEINHSELCGWVL